MDWKKENFCSQRHASSMLALCVVVRGATQSHKRERWSNKLDQRRCFYNDCCCIDSSRSSGALSIVLRRGRGGREGAIVARPRISAGCIIVHAIVIAVVVIVRPHPHEFYVQIPDPAGGRPAGKPALPPCSKCKREESRDGGRTGERASFFFPLPSVLSQSS